MTVRRAIAYSYLGQFLTIGFTFAGSVAAARILEPRDLGIYAVGAATMSILSVIGTVGTPAYVIREPDLTEKKFDTVFTVNAVICVALSLLVLTTSEVLARFLGAAGIGEVLHILALRPLLSIFEFRPLALLQRKMRFGIVAICAAAAAATNLAILLTLALHGLRYMSLAYAVIGGGIVSALLFNLLARRLVSFRLSLTDVAAIAAFCVRMVSISGMALAAQKVSEIIMGRLLGLAALGVFTRATNISDLVFANVYGTATRVMFAQMAEEQRRTGSFREAYLRGFDVLVGLMWPLLAGIAALSGPAIHTIFGTKWEAAAAPLALLMFAQAVAVCFGLNWELFVLRDQVRRQTGFEFVRAVFSVVSFAIGCLFSLAAASAGRIVDCLFGYGLYRRPMNRIAEVAPAEIHRIFARGAVLTIAAVAPTLAVMTMYRWSPAAPPLPLVGAVLAGTGCWIIVLAGFDHPLIDEIRHVVERLRTIVIRK